MMMNRLTRVLLIVWCGYASPQSAVGVPARGQEGRPLEREWTHGATAARLRLAPNEPSVADLVTVRLEITAPHGVQIELPDPKKLPKQFLIRDVRASGPRADADGRDLWTLAFRLEVLLPGTYELPSLEFRYREQPGSDWVVASTEPVPIAFQSVLGDDPALAEPKANPGLMPWPRSGMLWPVLAAIAAALLALAGLFAWLTLRRRPRPVPKISAHAKALQAITRLEQENWLERGEVDRFYTELSHVVREYVEERFGLRAPDQTTDEFLQELTDRPVLGAEQRSSLANFLEQCDLVKFARVRPTVAEGESALRAARQFVEATRDDSVVVVSENERS